MLSAVGRGSGCRWRNDLMQLAPIMSCVLQHEAHLRPLPMLGVLETPLEHTITSLVRFFTPRLSSCVVDDVVVAVFLHAGGTTCTNEPVAYTPEYREAVHRFVAGLRTAQGGLPDGGQMLGPLPEYKPHSRDDYTLYLFLKVGWCCCWSEVLVCVLVCECLMYLFCLKQRCCYAALC